MIYENVAIYYNNEVHGCKCKIWASEKDLSPQYLFKF